MPIATRTFRVFVSSTFEDLKAERNALQREVWPKLRGLCEQHGARFQAIDLRWGVRDEAAIDQKTMEICLREIERCQSTGIKPNFIVLLGQRYGWRPLPSRIEAAEFETVSKQIGVAADRATVESWYQRDDNAVPSEYVLKPRSGEWMEPATWQRLESRLHGILLDPARKAGLFQETRVKFEASATHQEILKGIGTTLEDRQHVFAFCRDVPDEDCDPDLVDLKRLLRERLAGKNVVDFAPGGFAKLCHDVEGALRLVIEQESTRFESRPALALEIEAHDAFARERAVVFGREEVFDGIASYLREGDPRPLVLHGPSGSGKSAVLAQASERAKSTLSSAVLIRRFIGASPESSSGLTLLHSLCEQIGEAYRASGDLPTDFNGVVRVFRQRLANASPQRPVIVFLDALDQLSKDDPAILLTWLAAELPPNCRIVASTTDLAPALNQANILEIPTLPGTDAKAALDHWLRDVHRQLQPAQRDRLLEAFGRCGLPLYLKLAFEEARNWPSRRPPDECLLGEDVEGIIDTLFDRLSLESNHGPLIVSQSLGYLAAARYGLTEDEIIDVLSADNEVWQDFERRAHHTPPERRLPVIVWSRLFLDLEPYLSERSALGGAVIAFYHRQLGDRIKAGQEMRHAALARYFHAQSVWLGDDGDVPNPRRATEMPFQQRAAHDWSAAEATLVDCQFLFAKCALGLVADLEADYRGVLAVVSSEPLRLLHMALVLSMQALGRDGKQYASQMVGRLLGLPKPVQVARFVDELQRSARKPWIQPLNPCLAPPGGPMLAWFDGHTSGVNAVAISEDGLLAISGGDDGTVRVWDLDRFVCKHVLSGHNDAVNTVALFRSTEGYVAVSGAGKRLPYKLATQFKQYIDETDQRPSRDNSIRVWDAQTGVLRSAVEGHTAAVRCFAISGSFLFSGSDDGTIRILNLDFPIESERVGVHGHPVVMLATIPALLSFSEYDFTLWKPDGTNVGMNPFDPFWQTPLAVYPQRFLIALVSTSFSGDNYGLQIWDIPNSHDRHEDIRTITSFDHFIAVARFLDDGTKIVAGEGDSGLHLIDIPTGDVKVRFDGHRGSVRCVDVASGVGKMISGSASGELIVWDLHAETSRNKGEGHTDDVNAAVFASNGRVAVTGSFDKSIVFWDVDNMRPIKKVATPRAVYCLSVSSDGRRVASGSATTVRGWDVSEGGLLWEAPCHRDGVVGLAFDEDAVVSASLDGTLCVLDATTGKVRLVFKEHSRPLGALAVIPGTGKVFSGDDTGVIVVWNLKDGSVLDRIQAFADVQAAAARQLDVPRGPEWPLVIGGIEPAIHSMAISEDGSLLVVSQGEDLIRAWNCQKGAEMKPLRGHSGRVHSVAFAAGRQEAISASHDGSVRRWDVSAGTTIAAFTSDRALYCCAISPDGNTIIVGEGGSGSVHFLRVVNAERNGTVAAPDKQ